MRGRRSFEAVDTGVLFALSIAFFALVGWALWREARTEWRPYQKEFAALLEKAGRLEEAAAFRPGIRQIWIPALGRVDRCVTCHLGYEYAGVLSADLPEPLKPHPALPWLRAHPFQKFGCTSCHGGQGPATREKDAHGEVPHWEEPLLGRKLAARYGLERRQLMEMRCNLCHRHDRSTPAMEEINQAKELFVKKKCLHCHTVEGHGGTTGPELTYIGDKNPELFDFSHVPPGPRTVFHWHVEHLRDPDVVTPGTEMPPYAFSEENARRLALLLLSWRRLSLPPSYIPSPPPREAAEVVRERPAPPVVPGAERGREVFLTRGCHTCHGVGEGRAIGPDLKGVGQRRTAAWLRQWLADPAAVLRAQPGLAAWPSKWSGIIMPNQNLEPDEIEALTQYLGRL